MYCISFLLLPSIQLMKFKKYASLQTLIVEIMQHSRETRRQTEKTNINMWYREKPGYSTQLEEFKESGAFYEDTDVVVAGNLVSSRA